jgi:pimeloyl-ACP methyl ester carboxylesterase
VNFASGTNTLQGFIYPMQKGGVIPSGQLNKADKTASSSAGTTAHKSALRPRGLVVVAPGLGQEGEEGYLGPICWFVDHGWEVFTYDDVGVNGSTGSSCVGLTQSTRDLDAALTYVEGAGASQFAGLNVVLFGHSWGGYAVTSILANHTHQIAAVASCAGYNTPDEELMYFGQRLIGNATYIIYPAVCIYNSVANAPDANLSAVAAISSTSTPVLIVQGSADDTVDTQNVCIMAHRDQITNPNVTYDLISDPDQNNHNTMLWSKEGNQYRTNILDPAWQKVVDKYGSDDAVPENERKLFVSTVNKAEANEVNIPLFTQINDFYEKALGQSA